MTKARITVENVIDRSYCTITSTVTPVTTFDLDFLKNMDRDKFARIPATASIDIKFTWGGDSVVVNMCSMNRINSEPADTDRFRAYASADWTGAAIVDTTAQQSVPSLALGDLAFGIDPLGTNLFDSFLGQKMNTRYFAEQTIGSAILTIDATANAQGVFDMARFFLGKSYELEANPVYGAGLRWNHNGRRNPRSKGGSPMNMRGSAWREAEFDLKLLLEADADMWMSAGRFLLEDKDFHFALFPDVAGNTFTDAQIRNHTGLWIFEKLPGVIAASYGRSDTSTLIVES